MGPLVGAAMTFKVIFRCGDMDRSLSQAGALPNSQSSTPRDAAVDGAETILWIAGGWSFPACSRRRAGCAIAIEQRNRGLLPYRPMRAFFVVVPTPILHFFPGVRKA